MAIIIVINISQIWVQAMPRALCPIPASFNNCFRPKMNECFCLFVLANQKERKENMWMIFRPNKRRKLISFLSASNENIPNPNGAILPSSGLPYFIFGLDARQFYFDIQNSFQNCVKFKLAEARQKKYDIN